MGDCSDLAALADWAAARGASALMTLPLCAPVSRPCEPSPYAPSSRLFWNEVYLDPRRQPELAESAAARTLIESPAFAGEMAALRRGPLVDPARQHVLRRPVLAALARAFFDRGSDPRRAAYEAYRAATPDLDDYAAFRAAAERFAGPWPAWPEPRRGGRLGRGDFDSGEADLHRYAQWAMSEQLAAASAAFPAGSEGLALDLPLGVHPDGYDAWRHRGLFAAGVSAGAPPDPLYEGGQDWGFAPFHPESQRADGYGYLSAALRRMLAVAGLLRIDHVMQLHRLYWVPAGAGAAEGVYVRYPAAELYAVACLEARRAGARLVGENLGTVPRAVDAAMRRHRLWGTWVLQHAIAPGSGPGSGRAHEPVPDDAVASLGTHDMPPFAAWWEGIDVDRRRDEGLLDEDEARAAAGWREAQRRALAEGLTAAGRLEPDERETGEREPRRVAAAALESLGASPSPLVFANLEDLWGEREPQNVPGPAHGRPNWLRRAALSLEELAADAEAAATLARLDEARRRPAEPAPPPSEAAASVAPPASGPLGPITPDDLYLFGEGRHFRLWEKLGAHPADLGGGPGVYFAVWAPHAERVSVIGDFNGWEPGRHPLAPLGGPGVWEGFVPGAHHGQRYKFRIESRLGGYRVDKADPFAFCTETPPATASVIWEPSYGWEDGEWMAGRAGRAGRDRPVALYEVHLGSWRRVPEDGNRPLSYHEAAPALADHLAALGFTHAELLPVMEHPFFGSWGYQTTSYFAPSRRFGDPEHLMALVDRLHRAGVGVVLDWVPSHFPADEHGLGWFDGAPLFEYADPREGWHPDWKSLIFNYASGEVRSFLISSALYWVERYHADGLRVDAVASMLHRDYSRGAGDWVPNAEGGRENWEAVDLLRQLNAELHRVPGVVTFAEESTAWPGVTAPAGDGGLGFDYKWDLGWMNDTLTYLGRDPIHRRHHHGELTFRGIYAFSESYILPLSHDEVVHGKGSLLAKPAGDAWQKLAQLRLLYAYQWTQPGKKLLFMGGEIGPWREWDHDSSLDWHLLADPAHAGLARWVADLNRLYRAEPALHRRDCDPAGFRWSVVDDADRSVLAYLRFGAEGNRPVLAAFNFTPVPRHGYPIGVPAAGIWTEALNSDAESYGGSGVGNLGGVEAVVGGEGAGEGGGEGGGESGPGGWPARLALNLPPLGMVILIGP
jgi:alpha-1,4-glucan:alpha-1,4-glucan 6-glycosyltransferase/4-alpha-glucanotransferase